MGWFNTVISGIKAFWPELLLLLLYGLLTSPLPIRLLEPGELATLEAARELHHAVSGWFPTFATHPQAGIPPLWPWLLTLAYQLFGESVATGRALSGVFGLLTGITLYGVSTQLFQRRWLSCLSVGILFTLWPFIFAVNSAGPMALQMWLSLLLLTLWPVTTVKITSRKRLSADPLRLLATGGLASLMFLTTGQVGFLGGALCPVLFIWRRERLQGPWWLAVVPVLLTQLVWFGVALSQHGLANPWAVFVSPSGLDFQNLNLWSCLAYWLLPPLLPWVLMMLPLGRRPSPPDRWINASLMSLLLLGVGLVTFCPLSGAAALAPFIALLLIQRLGIDAENRYILSQIRPLVDWTMCGLLLIAMVFTVWVFQYLPTEFYWPQWSLPGVPLLKSMTVMGHVIELDDPFPVWKLWLLPIPISLIMVATSTSLLSWIERFEFSLSWFTAGLLGVTLLVRSLALPILYPAYEQAFASRLVAHAEAVHTSHFSLDMRSFHNCAFFLPLNASQQNAASSDRVILTREVQLYELDELPDRQVIAKLPTVIHVPAAVIYH